MASRGRQKTRADKSGKFVFEVGPGNYTITATKKRYIRNSRNVSVSENIEKGTEADVFLSQKLKAGKSIN